MKNFTVFLMIILNIIFSLSTNKEVELMNYDDNDNQNANISTELTVVTLNSYIGGNCGKNVEDIASLLAAQNPDIICLQEVDLNTERSNVGDMMKLIAEKLSMNYIFFPSIELGSGYYGNGILSKHPILSTSISYLPSENFEQRSCGKAVISINGMPIDVFCTHLSYESLSTRTQQFSSLNEELKKSERFILCGDFNVESFKEFELISAQMINTENKPYSTYTTGDYYEYLDNIIFSDLFLHLESGMIETDLSDHNILIAKLSLS